jgi:dTDP-glucose 4,6-dehydratase
LKILVTGGCGFIGSAIVEELLKARHDVTILDNLSSGSPDNLRDVPNSSMVRIVVGDVRDHDVVTEIVKLHDKVIHLAAQAYIPYSYEFPTHVSDVNFTGTLNVLRACLESGTRRVVHVSSSEVYGTAKTVPMDETHPLSPESTYAVSKAASDMIARTLFLEHKLPVVVIRPFNSYGPRESLPYFIPDMIRQCVKSDRIVVGNLETSRDFTYVEDTAKAIVSSLDADSVLGEAINVGSEKTWRMSEILEMIMKMTGTQDKVVAVDQKRTRPQDVKMLLASSEKAYRLLGWKPLVDFRDGLRKTIEWYMANKSWPYERIGWAWRY